ncbi:MAG: putative zinc-binding protein [Planctomycetota bacterium]
MSDSPRQKTVLAPCMGVGKIVANVTRRAAYAIHAQCPEDVELLSIPALMAGDAHERELIQNNPTIIIDGCALRCTAHIFRQFGVDAVAKIEVNQVMKEKKIGPGKTRKELEETGKRLSDFTAEKVLMALNDEGLEARFVSPEELLLPPPEGMCGCPDQMFRATAVPLSPRERADTGHFSKMAVRGEGGAQDGDNAFGLIECPPLTPRAEQQARRPSPPGGEGNGDGSLRSQHLVTSVTVLPCQGIKRTGGRVTQRAAYEVVEDNFLGKSQVLCISALAAGCQEDVDMLEKFPTVAINGCNKRCASIAAEYHGVPAVAHVELPDVVPGFDCEAHCYEPDLTEKELAISSLLSAAATEVVGKLMGTEIDWAPGKINLHGLIHEPAKINSLTGYKDIGHGILVQLAKEQIERMNADAGIKAAASAVEKLNEQKAQHEVQAATMVCENPGLKTVMTGLFKPKKRN